MVIQGKQTQSWMKNDVEDEHEGFASTRLSTELEPLSAIKKNKQKKNKVPSDDEQNHEPGH